MRTLKSLGCLLVLGALLPGLAGAFASNRDRGTSTAGFLELGVGARAIALGEAYTAMADDATALYWNPAALSRVEKRSVTFMHASLIDSANLEYGSYAHNLGEWGTVAGGFQYLSAGEIIETDENNAQLGTFTPSDLAVTVGYAYEFKDTGTPELNGLSLGIGAKYIRSHIVDDASSGAVDMGILSPAFMDNKLRLAMALLHVGGRMKFESESSKLPLTLKLGSSWKWTDNVRTSLDLGFPNNEAAYAALGGEFLMPAGDKWNFAGRMGYNSKTSGDVTGFTGFSFGFGVSYMKFGVDYAFLPFGSVGNTHRVSLSAAF